MVQDKGRERKLCMWDVARKSGYGSLKNGQTGYIHTTKISKYRDYYLESWWWNHASIPVGSAKSSKATEQGTGCFLFAYSGLHQQN
jgi:hypothetical protein